MVNRLRAAGNARGQDPFVIMARTDAYAVEGFDAAVDRCLHYVEAGADMIFAEALTSIEEYKRFTEAVKVPVLANITEFGRTPLLTVEELKAAGVRMTLYPLSAFRAMSKAAVDVYEVIRNKGTQASVLNSMQTREELYEVLDYHKYEQANQNP